MRKFIPKPLRKTKIIFLKELSTNPAGMFLCKKQESSLTKDFKATCSDPQMTHMEMDVPKDTPVEDKSLVTNF